MSLHILADNVAATAGTITSLSNFKTPFMPNRVVEGYIVQNGMTGTVPEVRIESSPDDSTWTTQLKLVQIGGGKVGSVTCDKHMRGNVITAAGTLAGRVTIYLRAN